MSRSTWNQSIIKQENNIFNSYIKGNVNIFDQFAQVPIFVSSNFDVTMYMLPANNPKAGSHNELRACSLSLSCNSTRHEHNFFGTLVCQFH